MKERKNATIIIYICKKLQQLFVSETGKLSLRTTLCGLHCRVAFLRSFIPALFLHLFLVHSDFKKNLA